VQKQYLLAWILNVGRGNCAFVRTPSRDGMLIDCGGEEEIILSIKKYIIPLCRKHKASSGETQVGQVIISHPHIDHFRQISKAEGLNPRLWTCPHDKQPIKGYPDERLDWELVGNPEGSQELEDLYRTAYAEPKRRLPLQTFAPVSQIPYFSYGMFYIPPPQCKPVENSASISDSELPKKDYGNNTSIMVYFRFGKSSILFPGDMMASGMKRAIEVGCENRLVGEGIAPQFARRSASAEMLRKWINKGCTVLVAPHHGLESGYSNEFFTSLPIADPRVGIVVISEKAKPRKDEGNVHSNYQNREKVKGLRVIKQDGAKEVRLSVTTRTDGHCLVGFRGSEEVSVVVSEDLDWILTKGPERLFT